jgi:hypothetical protein
LQGVSHTFALLIHALGLLIQAWALYLSVTSSLVYYTFACTRSLVYYTFACLLHVPSALQDLWVQAWALYLSVTRPPASVKPDAKTLPLLAESMPSDQRSSLLSAQILRDARVFGLPLPAHALHALLPGLCQTGHLQDALAVVRSMEDATATTVPLLHMLMGFVDEQERLGYIPEDAIASTRREARTSHPIE